MTAPLEIRTVDTSNRAEWETLLRDDDSNITARIVLVLVRGDGLHSSDLAALTGRLSSPRLISVGVVQGAVSATMATLLFACDFALADPDCDWSAARGAIDAATTSRNPGATTMCALPTPIASAAVAQRGLLSEVTREPLDAGMRLAQELSQVSAGSLAGTKEMIDAAMTDDLATALALESARQIPLLMGEEHRRIVEATRAAKPAP